MPLPIPPWLQQPADLAGNYMQGLHAGAAVAQQQAQLQAESNRMQVEIAQRQNAEQLAAQRQQAQLEMAKAYHDQTTQLRQTALAQQKQKIDLSTSLAARRFQAQQQYQQAVAAGADPSEVLMQLGPQLGMPAAAMAAAARSRQHAVWIPENKETGAPGHFESPSGAVHIPASPRQTGQLGPRDIFNSLQREEASLAKDHMIGMDASKSPNPDMKQEILAKQARLKELRQKIQMYQDNLVPDTRGTMSAPAAPGAPAPLNLPPGPQGAPAGPAAPQQPTTRGISIVRDNSGRLVVATGTQQAPSQQPVKPPAPNISLDSFLKRLKSEKRKSPEIAVDYLGHAIAEAVGFPKDHPALRIGGSVFSHDPGTVFSEALLHNKSSKFPGITGKIVWDYLKQLPEAQRSEMLTTALQQAGMDMPQEQAPVPAAPKAAPAVAQAQGFE